MYIFNSQCMQIRILTVMFLSHSQATPTAYLTGIPGASTQVANTYTPYFSAAGPLIGPTAIITSDPNNPLAMTVQQTMVTQQKMPRNDRLDVSKIKKTNPFSTLYSFIFILSTNFCFPPNYE